MHLSQELGQKIRRITSSFPWEQILALALAACMALLLACAAGLGMALRAGSLPPFDVHLTLDGRHALVIQNDLPWTPDEPPQCACATGDMRGEFKMLYSTPSDDRV